MKISTGLIALFCSILMSACSAPAVELTSTPSATASLTNTWTPFPTSTATMDPTATFTSTATPTKTLTPTMTPTPTRVFVGMNTPFPADPLELTVVKAWIERGDRIINFPDFSIESSRPEIIILVVRLQINRTDGKFIKLEHVKENIYIQVGNGEKIHINIIVSGGVDKAKAHSFGDLTTWEPTWGGLYQEDLADYLFELEIEPNLEDEIYLFWENTYPVRIIVSED